MSTHRTTITTSLILALSALLVGATSASAESANGTGVRGTMKVSFEYRSMLPARDDVPARSHRRWGSMEVAFDPSLAARRRTLAAIRADNAGASTFGTLGKFLKYPSYIQAARVTSLNVTDTDTVLCSASSDFNPVAHPFTTVANTILDDKVAYDFSDIKLDLIQGRGELSMRQDVLSGKYVQKDAGPYPCTVDPRQDWIEQHHGWAPIFAGSLGHEPLARHVNSWLYSPFGWKLRREKGRWRVLMNHPRKTETHTDDRINETISETIRATSNLHLVGTPRQLNAWCKVPTYASSSYLRARTLGQARSIVRRAGITARLPVKTKTERYGPRRVSYRLEGANARTGPITSSGDALCGRGGYRIVKVVRPRS